MKIDEWRMMASLREIFFKQTEYIYSTFDVRRSSVSFSIKLAVFLASDAAHMKLQSIGRQCHQLYIHFSWERLPAAKKVALSLSSRLACDEASRVEADPTINIS